MDEEREEKEEEKEQKIDNEEELIEKIASKVKNYAVAEWNEIIRFVRRPWRLLLVNFLLGLLRGIGFFLGMTIVGAVVVALLIGIFKPFINKVAQLNIPVISNFLAKLIKEIQNNLKVLQGG
ncbi:MAG: hypothetical protein DRI36_01365 [Caldiserica bacterium]|nr:MAG: hypothetical protein DRI36_01365 [Caldisericota bacterium]